MSESDRPCPDFVMTDLDRVIELTPRPQIPDEAFTVEQYCQRVAETSGEPVGSHAARDMLKTMAERGQLCMAKASIRGRGPTLYFWLKQ